MKKYFILSLFLSFILLTFSSCRMVSEGKWLDKYTPDNNDNMFVLEGFDLKAVASPAQVQAVIDSIRQDTVVWNGNVIPPNIELEKQSGVNLAGNELGDPGSLRPTSPMLSLQPPYQTAYITSAFAYRNYSGGHMHLGIDIVSVGDKNIKASGEGTVLRTGFNQWMGNFIAINYSEPTNYAFANEIYWARQRWNDHYDVAWTSAELSRFREILKDVDHRKYIEDVQKRQLHAQAEIALNDLKDSVRDNIAEGSIQVWLSLLIAWIEFGRPSTPLNFSASVVTYEEMQNLLSSQASSWNKHAYDMTLLFNRMDSMFNSGSNYFPERYPNQPFTEWLLDCYVAYKVFHGFHDYVEMGSTGRPVFGYDEWTDAKGAAIIRDLEIAVNNNVPRRHVMFIYMHLASVSVAQNAQVTLGDVIGVEGTTGDSTGVHLHLGTYFGESYEGQVLSYNSNNPIVDSRRVDPDWYTVNNSLGFNIVCPIRGVFGTQTRSEYITKFPGYDLYARDGVGIQATEAQLRAMFRAKYRTPTDDEITFLANEMYRFNRLYGTTYEDWR